MCYQSSDLGEEEGNLILLLLSDPEQCHWKGSNKAMMLAFLNNISYNKKKKSLQGMRKRLSKLNLVPWSLLLIAVVEALWNKISKKKEGDATLSFLPVTLCYHGKGKRHLKLNTLIWNIQNQGMIFDIHSWL